MILLPAVKASLSWGFRSGVVEGLKLIGLWALSGVEECSNTMRVGHPWVPLFWGTPLGFLMLSGSWNLEVCGRALGVLICVYDFVWMLECIRAVVSLARFIVYMVWKYGFLFRMTGGELARVCVCVCVLLLDVCGAEGFILFCPGSSCSIPTGLSTCKSTMQYFFTEFNAATTTTTTTTTATL